MSSLVVNQAAYSRFLYSPAGPVMAGFRDQGNRVLAEAVRNTPVDTGQHRASLEMTQAREGALIVTRVGSPLATWIYLEKGTGIYGPKKKLIYPVSKKVLRFKPGRFIGPLPQGKRGTSPEKRGNWIYAKHVKGTPRHDILVNALRDMTPYPVVVTPD